MIERNENYVPPERIDFSTLTRENLEKEMNSIKEKYTEKELTQLASEHLCNPSSTRSVNHYLMCSYLMCDFLLKSKIWKNVENFKENIWVDRPFWTIA